MGLFRSSYMHIITRDVPAKACHTLEQAGINPLLARLYAARGVQHPSELDDGLAQLLPPDTLKGSDQAAQLLADAITQQKRMCVVADYDCDGATACVVAVRGLRLLGAQHVSYLVPDRIQDGYGLTPTLAERVHQQGAEVLITVDNGIASIEGVDHAKKLGLRVIVTDHHLPAETLPQADALVNPNQPECDFASKSLAGVGVIFYVLLALRAHMRSKGVFTSSNQPKLDTLLPLVALGTIADVVVLDANNRRLVAQGLKRIRNCLMPAGMAALFSVSRRDARSANTFDLGFALGPRLNAAGRMASMDLGVACLLTDDAPQAHQMAMELDNINRSRRYTEDDMRQQALAMTEKLMLDPSTPPAAISVFEADFHEGVIGIVAARIKENMHRPTFVFASSAAEGKTHEIKGSGRSIAGFHLRDALDLLAKRHPNVLLRFGGHAAAAGCTIAKDQFVTFQTALAKIAAEWLDADTLQRTVHTDGALPAQFRTLSTASNLQSQVWGQGFAAPLFSEEMAVISQRIVGEKHLKLQLRHHDAVVDGIFFGREQSLPSRAKLAYRLDINEWQGKQSIQFIVEAVAE